MNDENNPALRPADLEPKNLIERLRDMGEPLETVVTPELRAFLESAFSPYFERSFLLFSKDGATSKAIESTHPNSPKSFAFPTAQMNEAIPAMEAHGYSYVGTYHHHLDSDRQVKIRKHPPRDMEAYQMPDAYDPIQMSPDDHGVFNSIGFSLVGENDPEALRIMAGVRYLFLGHRSEAHDYRIKCYSVLSRLPVTHPWNVLRDKISTAGYMVTHYRSYDDILDHPLEVTGAQDSDPEALDILNQACVKNRKHELIISDSGGEGILRVFTQAGAVSFVEVETGGKLQRYWFDEEGSLTRSAIYGDNTTRMEKTNIESIPPSELDQLRRDFESMYGELVRGIMSPNHANFSAI